MCDSLDSNEFEQAVANVFTEFGFFAVRKRVLGGPIHDHYRPDVVVSNLSHQPSFRWIVECKLWQDKVNAEAVYKLKAWMDDVGNVDHGFVIAVNGFLPSAVAAAKARDITLVSSDTPRFATEDSPRTRRRRTRSSRCRTCGWPGEI